MSHVTDNVIQPPLLKMISESSQLHIVISVVSWQSYSTEKEGSFLQSEWCGRWRDGWRSAAEIETIRGTTKIREQITVVPSTSKYHVRKGQVWERARVEHRVYAYWEQSLWLSSCVNITVQEESGQDSWVEGPYAHLVSGAHPNNNLQNNHRWKRLKPTRRYTPQLKT